MLSISSGDLRNKNIFRGGDEFIYENPSYINNLEKGVVSAGSIKLRYDESGLEYGILGPENVIIYADQVSGHFFANGFMGGLVSVGENSDSDIVSKVPNAFSRQVGGSIKFGKIKDDMIAIERYSGVLEGFSVVGGHFERDKKGGVTSIQKVSGYKPWKNKDGGFVSVGEFKGEEPFLDMKSGLAIVGKLENKGGNIIGSHDGGTVITSDASLTDNDAINEELLEQALVITGKNSRKKLNAFADNVLKNHTVPYLVEQYNSVVWNCIYEKYNDMMKKGLDDTDIDDFNNYIKEWIVPVNVKDILIYSDEESMIVDYQETKKQLHENRNKLYQFSMLSVVNKKISKLSKDTPDIFKGIVSKGTDEPNIFGAIQSSVKNLNSKNAIKLFMKDKKTGELNVGRLNTSEAMIKISEEVFGMNIFKGPKSFF